MTSATSACVDAKLLQGRAAEQQRGFERLAYLVVDADIDQPDRSTPVVGARQHRHERELGFHVFGDADGGFRLVDADQDCARPAGAGGMQYVEPRSVAVIDLEAEIGGRLDHLDVIVDDRDVDAPEQQAAG